MKKVLLIIALVIGINASAQNYIGTIDGLTRKLESRGYSFDSKDKGYISFMKDIRYSGYTKEANIFFNSDNTVWGFQDLVEPTYVSKMNSQWATQTYINSINGIKKNYKKLFRKHKVGISYNNDITDWRENYILKQAFFQFSDDYRISVRMIRSKEKEKVTTKDNSVYYKYAYYVSYFQEHKSASGKWITDIFYSNKENENPFKN